MLREIHDEGGSKRHPRGGAQPERRSRPACVPPLVAGEALRTGVHAPVPSKRATSKPDVYLRALQGSGRDRPTCFDLLRMPSFEPACTPPLAPDDALRTGTLAPARAERGPSDRHIRRSVPRRRTSDRGAWLRARRGSGRDRPTCFDLFQTRHFEPVCGPPLARGDAGEARRRDAPAGAMRAVRLQAARDLWTCHRQPRVLPCLDTALDGGGAPIAALPVFLRPSSGCRFVGTGAIKIDCPVMRECRENGLELLQGESSLQEHPPAPRLVRVGADQGGLPRLRLGPGFPHGYSQSVRHDSPPNEEYGAGPSAPSMAQAQRLCRLLLLGSRV